MRFQTLGEGDECRCPKCRGADLPGWLWRLDERPADGPEVGSGLGDGRTAPGLP